MDYKISTITAIINIEDCILNLYNIGKYLEIDDEILGIKYNNYEENIIKGKYVTSLYKKSKNKKKEKINKNIFYNQVSILIKIKNKEINLKIFNNGTIHITGLKNIEDYNEIKNILYDKFEKMKNKKVTIILTKDENGIYLDNSNNIYLIINNKIQNCGYKSGGFYIINKKEYYIEELSNGNKVFILNKFTNNKVKIIYNLNMIEIGYSKIKLLKNMKKLYKNSNIFIEKNVIMYNKNNTNIIILGNIEYVLNSNCNNITFFDKSVVEYTYICDPYIKEPNDDLKEKAMLSINNINIYFNINKKINRQNLFEKLIKLNYIVEYSPERYSGIRFIFKINKNYISNGRCICDTKCTCNNITFLIFQTGNIIGTGFKCVNEIENILLIFRELI